MNKNLVSQKWDSIAFCISGEIVIFVALRRFFVISQILALTCLGRLFLIPTCSWIMFREKQNFKPGH